MSTTCRQSSITEFTPPDSTHVGSFQRKSHFISLSVINVVLVPDSSNSFTVWMSCEDTIMMSPYQRLRVQLASRHHYWLHPHQRVPIWETSIAKVVEWIGFLKRISRLTVKFVTRTKLWLYSIFYPSGDYFLLNTEASLLLNLSALRATWFSNYSGSCLEYHTVNY